ncbi:MAG: hypothetical protein KKH88_02460 [Nanoarchaeota archaeon]|nr:hypothetical protein [Nanoarchaeota archaeon]
MSGYDKLRDFGRNVYGKAVLAGAAIALVAGIAGCGMKSYDSGNPTDEPYDPNRSSEVGEYIPLRVGPYRPGVHTPQEHADLLIRDGQCEEAYDHIREQAGSFQKGELHYFLGRAYACIADESEGAKRDSALLNAYSNYFTASVSRWGNATDSRSEALDEAVELILDEMEEEGLVKTGHIKAGYR